MYHFFIFEQLKKLTKVSLWAKQHCFEIIVRRAKLYRFSSPNVQNFTDCAHQPCSQSSQSKKSENVDNSCVTTSKSRKQQKHFQGISLDPSYRTQTEIQKNKKNMIRQPLTISIAAFILQKPEALPSCPSPKMGKSATPFLALPSPRASTSKT